MPDIDPTIAVVETPITEPVVDVKPAEGEPTPGTAEPAKPEWHGTWRGQLPTDLREREEFKTFKTYGELAADWLKRKESEGDYVKVPGEEATDEELNTFREKMGVPLKMEEYKFEEPKLPEGLPKDEGMLTAFQKFAFENNLSTNHAKGLYAWYNEYRSTLWNQYQARRKEQADKAEADMRLAWGSSYDEKTAQIDRFIDEQGNEDLVKVFNENALYRNRIVMDWIYGLSGKFQEDKLVPGELVVKVPEKSAERRLGEPPRIKYGPEWDAYVEETT